MPMSTMDDVKPRLFVSYRRTDCLIYSSALVDGLMHRLSDWSIFRDIESIPAGVDWRERISREILVLIGDNWLDRKDDGSRRIDDPDDELAHEISTALEREVITIPVLVEEAEMPTATDLPPAVKRLARFNALSLSDLNWTADVDRLVVELRRIKSQVQPQPTGAGEALEMPSRVTAAWLSSTVPTLSREQLNELVLELRRRRWGDGEIRDTVFSLARAEARPAPRELTGNARRARSLQLPARISVRWLEQSVPDLDSDELAALVNELRRRGWSEGEIEDQVYTIAADGAVGPQTF